MIHSMWFMSVKINIIKNIQILVISLQNNYYELLESQDLTATEEFCDSKARLKKLDGKAKTFH